MKCFPYRVFKEREKIYVTNTHMRKMPIEAVDLCSVTKHLQKHHFSS